MASNMKCGPFWRIWALGSHVVMNGNNSLLYYTLCREATMFGRLGLYSLQCFKLTLGFLGSKPTCVHNVLLSQLRVASHVITSHLIWSSWCVSKVLVNVSTGQLKKLKLQEERKFPQDHSVHRGGEDTEIRSSEPKSHALSHLLDKSR